MRKKLKDNGLDLLAGMAVAIFGIACFWAGTLYGMGIAPEVLPENYQLPTLSCGQPPQLACTGEQVVELMGGKP